MATANLTELQQLDASTAQYEAALQRGKDLEELKKNPLFISVIMEGYLEAEAERLFDTLTMVPAIRRESLDNTQSKLEAVRHFKEYVGTATYPGIVMREAENAQSHIDENEMYRTALLADNSASEV